MNLATKEEVEKYLRDKYVVAGTGSKGFDWNNDLETLDLSFAVEDLMAAHENLVLVSGMSVGWDAAIAQMAILYKLPWIACVPNKDYGSFYWGKEGRYKDFLGYLEQATLVEYTNPSHYGKNGMAGHANFDRNQRMVDIANHFLIYDAGTPGTRDCVKRIKKSGKTFQNFGA